MNVCGDKLPRVNDNADHYVVKLENQLKCYEEQLKNKDKQIEELRSIIKILVGHMK